MRFSASLGFRVEEGTAAAMLDSRGLLRNISAERVFAELSGLLTGRKSGGNIRRVLTQFRDILAEVVPEFRAGFDFEQHSRFHCLDVYQHLLASAEAAARIAPGELPLALAMLFHDIGKPERFTRDESGEGHFYGHAQVSADIADSVLRRLRASTALREQVCGIVRYHDISLPENDRQFRRMLSKHGEELSRDIAMAHIADDMAKKPECLPRCEDWRRLIARIPEMAQESCLSVKSLAVDGRALSGIVPPSPLMGKVLKFLLDGVMDGKFPNEREFLLQEAAKYIANRQKT